MFLLLFIIYIYSLYWFVNYIFCGILYIYLIIFEGYIDQCKQSLSFHFTILESLYINKYIKKSIELINLFLYNAFYITLC